jgi:hypothetical protein
VLGEDEDFGGGHGVADERSGFEAVEAGHADVHDYDVGGELAGFFDGILAIKGFAADFVIGLGLNEGADAAAHNFVVIDD